MSAESRPEAARRLFLEGANCAQAVLAAFAGEAGLDPATAYRIGAGLGGGMGRLREVCGTFSAMVILAGLIRGSADPADKAAKDRQYELTQEMARRFRERNGSIVCRELLGLPAEYRDGPVSEARTAAYYRKRPCADLVYDAAALLDEMLFAGKAQTR